MTSTRRLRSVAAFASLLVCLTAAAGPEDDRARTERLEDFDAFCRFVGDEYAYFDVKKTDWSAACAAHRPMAAMAANRGAFIDVVGATLAELYDAHAHLGTSTSRTPRLVPTDGDLYATWRGDDAMVVDVRVGSSAEAAGLHAGMRVVEIDGQPVAEAVDALAPQHLVSPDPAARDWALRVALAGHQDREPVRVVVEDEGARRSFAFVPGLVRPASPLSVRRIGDVGVVTIHNMLGDMRLVSAFDDALVTLKGATSLVLDLRDTPSGGNTAVARGLMGRLVARESPYQRHERTGEARATGIRRVWVEYVEPRGTPFTGPVVVLVGRWTGSMGEGIALGLNTARDAPVVGTPMAGLLGALDVLRLPHAGFEVRIPAEKLFHVDGTPREAFVPCALAMRAGDGGDAMLAAAVRVATTGLLPRSSTFVTPAKAEAQVACTSLGNELGSRPSPR